MRVDPEVNKWQAIFEIQDGGVFILKFRNLCIFNETVASYIYLSMFPSNLIRPSQEVEGDPTICTPTRTHPPRNIDTKMCTSHNAGVRKLVVVTQPLLPPRMRENANSFSPFSSFSFLALLNSCAQTPRPLSTLNGSKDVDHRKKVAFVCLHKFRSLLGVNPLKTTPETPQVLKS